MYVLRRVLSKAIHRPCGEPVESIVLREAFVLRLGLPHFTYQVGGSLIPWGMGMAFPLAKHVPTDRLASLKALHCDISAANRSAF